MIAGWYGSWAGWLAVRWLATSGWIAFPLTAPPPGVRTHSFHLGYAKGQDFFWYAAAAAAGLAGASLAVRGARWLDRHGRGPARDRRWAPVAGVLALAAATVLGCSHRFAGSTGMAALVLAGALLPWVDRRWIRGGSGRTGLPEPPPAAPAPAAFPFRLRSGSALLIAGLAFLAVVDPCMRYRGVDGHHEGNMLLYAVHASHGEVPGLDFRPEYGPLFIHTFTRWMEALGMVVVNERRYFAVAQWLGAALHLAVIGLLCRSGYARAAGGWMMLTVTTAPFVQYGWANGLRTALPLLGFALAWRAVTRPGLAAAGAISAAGWWYSQEYGAAAALGAAVTLLLRRDLGWRDRAGWALGAGLAGGLAIPLLLYGARMPEALAAAPGGGMLAAKLRGSGSVPFPPLIGWDAGPGRLRTFWWNNILTLQLWLPVLLAGPALGAALAGGGVRDGRGPLLAGLAVVALLYQWPAVVRPIDQIRMCVVGALALGAVLLDPVGARRRWLARAVVLGVLAYGALHLYSVRDSLKDRAFCLRVGGPYPAVRLARLGEIWLPPEEERRETALVETIRQLCPPDGRVYSGAAWDAHVLFLADRMGVSPYPVPFTTQDAVRRAEAAAALARSQPAVVLIHRQGVDLPWEEDRREEWDWIRPRYRKHSVFGRVEVWVPK